MGDITSPFPYRKGGKSIYWSTSSIYIEIKKGVFPYIVKKKGKGKINLLKLILSPKSLKLKFLGIRDEYEKSVEDALASFPVPPRFTLSSLRRPERATTPG